MVATAAATPAIVLPTHAPPLFTRQVGAVMVAANRAPNGHVSAVVSNSFADSKATFEAFLQQMRGAGASLPLAEEVSFAVLFKQPVSIAGIDELLRQTGVRPLSYQVRVMSSTGRRGTLTMMADGEGPGVGNIPRVRERLAAFTVPMDTKPATMEGVFILQAKASRAAFERLASRPEVFVADVSHYVARKAVADELGVPVEAVSALPSRGYVRQARAFGLLTHPSWE